MPRFAPLITMDELKEKLKPILEDDEFPYELPAIVAKDLGKIQFDFENFEIGEEEKIIRTGIGICNYPCGFQKLSNGLPVLFVNAGGDWEYPICFVLYWDGKHVRGYIPTDGNVFNTKAKTAYGSEGDSDVAGFDPDEFPEGDHDELPEGDPEKIKNDVMKRIIIR